MKSDGVRQRLPIGCRIVTRLAGPVWVLWLLLIGPGMIAALELGSEAGCRILEGGYVPGREGM